MTIKKLGRNLATVMISIAFLLGNIPSYTSATEIEMQSLSMDKKAVWISYLDFGMLKDKSESVFRNNVNMIYQNVADQGLDTVIVHVRSFSDAIYPSAYYPWASFVSSNESGLDYDPLKIMIDMAHEKNLKFEAWVNPYRISTSSTKTSQIKNQTSNTVFSQLLKNPGESIVEYDSGGENCMSLNPGSETARQLIVDGVKEIVQKYDVDGIHFDDYFYVPGVFNEVPDEEKRENVNLLIRNVYQSIKEVKPNIVFGISPAGNIQNCMSIGADVETWLSQEGYVDYIMPQIYWTNQYGSAGNITMFSNRLKEWKNLLKNSAKMYAGLALYNVVDRPSSDIGWGQKNTNLKEQVIEAVGSGCSGYALFRYNYITNASAAEELANLKEIETQNNSGYINYRTHVQTYGWQNVVSDGQSSGTVGEYKRLEGIEISLNIPDVSGGVQYRTHVQTHGWQDWVSDGATSGTTGEAKRLEAICIQLTGEAAEKYDIYYRVHAQTYGWLDWARNGQEAGTAGLSKRLEAIQIKVVPKGQAAPGNTARPYIDDNAVISYKTHVQTYGWQNFVSNGQSSGTSGQAKRLEGICIQIGNSALNGDVNYRTHVQTYGWQPYVNNGAMSGTTGEAKRLEAIEISLTGEMEKTYDIYYRVHIQTYGWLGWAKNGSPAGSQGLAKRLEAIQIQLVKKGGSAPGSVNRPFIQ